jgi:hypothetical protein
MLRSHPTADSNSAQQATPKRKEQNTISDASTRAEGFPEVTLSGLSHQSEALQSQTSAQTGWVIRPQIVVEREPAQSRRVASVDPIRA